MPAEIISAIISVFGTLGGAFFGVVASAKLTAYRIEQLEKKVDKHNGFAEVIPVIQSQISTIYHELNEIKGVRE